MASQMFSRFRVWFSDDGQDYQTYPEISETITIDTGSSTAATVLSASIALRSRVGKFVKLELGVAGKWLILSEVTFHTGMLFRFQ